MTDVVIALGSNVGDSAMHLQEATRRIADTFQLIATSQVYETAPMYVTDQPAFLNAALLIRTAVGPRMVLSHLKQLEREIGRRERHVCGPREIDLDLIAYGSLVYRYHDGDRLVLHVPHPRVAERRFVLQPVADIAANLLLPGIGVVSELLKQTESQVDSVKKVDHALLPVQRHE